jgi:hypothetical protein
MLEKLLAEIRSGGTFETGELASRLGTTPEMLNAMLGHLQRSGFIQPYRTCGDTCGSCSLQESCHTLQADQPPDHTLRLLTLTES